MVGMRLGSSSAEDHEYQAEVGVGRTQRHSGNMEALQERHDQIALSKAFPGRTD